MSVYQLLIINMFVFAVNRKDILTMLRTVFSTLTVAMRYEPANAKFFATEVRQDELSYVVKLI